MLVGFPGGSRARYVIEIIIIMKNTKFIISCPIFEDELNMTLPYNSNNIIHLMDHRIHNNADRMEIELKNAILKAKSIDADIYLLVGHGCYCDTPISQIAENANAKYPLEKNCIEIILGPERTKELQKNRTSILTQGWIKMIQGAIQHKVWTETDARIAFGYFDRLLLLDYGNILLTDEEILYLYDLFQVPIEIEQCEMDYFQEILNQLLG